MTYFSVHDFSVLPLPVCSLRSSRLCGSFSAFRFACGSAALGFVRLRFVCIRVHSWFSASSWRLCAFVVVSAGCYFVPMIFLSCLPISSLRSSVFLSSVCLSRPYLTGPGHFSRVDLTGQTTEKPSEHWVLSGSRVKRGCML